MKRILLIAAACLTFAANAQVKPGPLVSSAKIALDKTDVVKAKKYIDEAQAAIEAGGALNARQTAKYYWYRGDIHLAYFNFSEGEHTDEVLNEAHQAYESLLTYEESIGKSWYSSKAQTNLVSVAAEYFALAHETLENKDTAKSIELYSTVYDIRHNLGTIDTLTLSQLAYLNVATQNYDQAERLYKKVIGFGFKNVYWSAELTNEENPGRTVFPDKKTLDFYIATEQAINPERSESMEHEAYVRLLHIYLNQSETKFDSLIPVARIKFPQNETILKLQLQQFYNKKDYQGALNALNEVLKIDPDNAGMYYFNIGIIYDNEIQPREHEKAMEYYRMAVEADPNQADAYFMMGMSHLEESNEWVQKMNKLSYREQTKHDQYDAKRLECMSNALGFFEKAYAANAKDIETLRSLMTIHYQLGNVDEFKRFKEEMATAEQEAEAVPGL